MFKATEKTKIRPRRAWVLSLACVLVAALAAFSLAGCSSGDQASSSSGASASSATDQVESLEGAELDIYCGAGMTDAFEKIASAFEDESGCKVNVTYANAAQIQTQITTTETGDFFIAGSSDELAPVGSYVAEQVDLVKHIPVLAVPKDNPKNITCLADLSECERFLTGDPDSTPIGKIAKNAMTKAGVWDTLMNAGAITTTTTAPQISTALANGEGDAGIVWKENVTSDGAVIVDTADLDAFVKTIPSARLTCSTNTDSADAFAQFLQTDTAWDIWAEFGYERV